VSAPAKTKKEDNNAFLLQHIDILFSRAKSKFPAHLQIKILYAVFLSDHLNNKQQAIAEINECEMDHRRTFEEEFQCFRLKKQIEELERTGGSSSYTPQFNNGNVTTFRGSQGPTSEERKTIPPSGSRRFGDHRGEGGQPRRFGEQGTSGTTHQTSSNGGNTNNFTNSADKFKNR
jgi:hypothetical protein